MSTLPLWVVDDVLTLPGQGKAFFAAYLERYVPKAQAVGMTLAHRMVEPAMWLDDASNRLLFVWTMTDPGAVWGAKQQMRMDAEVTRWWTEEAPAFIVSRKRLTMADADALEGLANV
jgi:hypothetical protein